MRQKAKLGPWASLIIGTIVTLIVGAAGCAVSIRLANNANVVAVDCCLNKSNPEKSITINADKGKLYYALENVTSKKNTYTVKYKTSNSGSYVVGFSGAICSGDMVGYNYACKASGWSKRYFKVKQTNNLGSSTTHCFFYAEVRN